MTRSIFPWLSMIWFENQALSRPGICNNQIPWLSRISMTRTNPDLYNNISLIKNLSHTTLLICKEDHKEDYPLSAVQQMDYHLIVVFYPFFYLYHKSNKKYLDVTSQAAWQELNNFVSNSIHCNMVGYKEEIMKTISYWISGLNILCHIFSANFHITFMTQYSSKWIWSYHFLHTDYLNATFWFRKS